MGFRFIWPLMAMILVLGSGAMLLAEGVGYR